MKINNKNTNKNSDKEKMKSFVTGDNPKSKSSSNYENNPDDFDLVNEDYNYSDSYSNEKEHIENKETKNHYAESMRQIKPDFNDSHSVTSKKLMIANANLNDVYNLYSKINQQLTFYKRESDLLKKQLETTKKELASVKQKLNIVNSEREKDYSFYEDRIENLRVDKALLDSKNEQLKHKISMLERKLKESEQEMQDVVKEAQEFKDSIPDIIAKNQEIAHKKQQYQNSQRFWFDTNLKY